MFGLFANSIGKSIPQGAATTMYAAVSPQLDKEGGKYYADCNLEPTNHPCLSAIPDIAQRLWQASVKLTGSDLPFKTGGQSGDKKQLV